MFVSSGSFHQGWNSRNTRRNTAMNCSFQRGLVHDFGCTESLEARAAQFSNVGVEVEAPFAAPQVKGESNSVAEYSPDFFEHQCV